MSLSLQFESPKLTFYPRWGAGGHIVGTMLTESRNKQRNKQTKTHDPFSKEKTIKED